MRKLLFYVILLLILVSSAVALPNWIQTIQPSQNKTSTTNPFVNYIYFFDGNYSTIAQEDGDTFHNYSIPANASQAVLMVQDNFVGLINYTFTSLYHGCYRNRTTLQMRIWAVAGTLQYICYHYQAGNWNYYLYDNSLAKAIDINEFSLWFYVNTSIGNASQYDYPSVNISYYGYDSTLSNANKAYNLTCSDETFTFNSQGTPSDQLTLQHNVTEQCDMTIQYSAEFTNNYDYTRTFTNITFDDSIYHINITVPKLELYFSEATDVKIVDEENIWFYPEVDVLIALSNLSLGKVSVIYNNGTQFYEFTNDGSTYIYQNLTVVDTDTTINVRLQDPAFTVIDDGTLMIYDITDNESGIFISRYHNFLDADVHLNSGHNYLIRAYADGYNQTNGFSILKPEDWTTKTFIITMEEVTESSYYNIYMDSPSSIYFTDTNPKTINVYIDSLVALTSAQMLWYVNGTLDETYTLPSSGYYSWSNSNYFNPSDGTHTIYVYANGDLERTLSITRRTKTQVSSGLPTLRTSLAAFIIFFIVSIAIAGTVYKLHKNYGIEAFAAMMGLFAFLNNLAAIIAVTLIGGLIIRQVLQSNEN